MALKTSLLITGDASTAQKAVDDVKRSVEALGAAGKGAAGGVAAVAGAEDIAAAAARAMATASGEATGAVREMAAADSSAAGALSALGAGATGSAGAIDGATKKVRQHTLAINDNDKEAQRNAFGVRNLGQQFGDLAVQIQGGIDPARAFATQAGQMGYALSEMNGKAGAVGKFLVGPWGVALTIAVSVLAPFVEKLFQSGEASDSAAKKMLSQAESAAALADAIRDLDKATAASIRTAQQSANAAYIDAINLRNQEIATRNLTKAKLENAIAEQKSSREYAQGTTQGAEIAGLGLSRGDRRIADLRRDLQANDDAIAGAQRSANRLKAPILQRFASEQTDKNAAATGRYERTLDQLNKQLTAGTIAEGEYVSRLAAAQRARDGVTKASSAGAVAGVADAAQQARLSAASSDTARAQAELAITRRQGAEALKAGTITQAEYTARLTAGEQAVNRARDAEKAAREAKTDHAKATRDAAAAVRELDSAYAEVTRRLDPIANATREYEKQLAAIAKLRGAGRIGIGDDVALTIAAQGDRDKAVGAEQAQQLKRAFELANPGQSIESGLIHAAIEASERLKEGAAQAGTELSRAIGTAGSILSDLFPDGGSSAIGRATKAGGKLFSLLGKSGDAQEEKLSGAITTIASKGLGISDAAAGKIGEFGGKAIRGAAEGALANSVFAPIAKGLGIKTSGTGAQIGGAIGSALPIPGGSIIGSIAGSVIGGLFKSTPQGKVTLTSATGDVSATGNSGAAKKVAVGLAGSVQDALQGIAEQLGGGLGSFNVTVGQRHGDYRVTTGSSLKVKKGAQDFDDDQAGAIGAAVQIAISQGAVTGLSTAIQKAIKSSSDVNAALKEALKVQDVELLAKGISGQFEKAFADLEATAKDRVRIAREYGIDVVAIEKRNADDRLKLNEQLVKGQAGSLQALVTELTSGSLFEGSAIDKIEALNVRIAKARTDLEAGVDGAGDALADLYQQRIAAAKDAYGTTGAYASTRNSTIAEAQAAVARVNAQITAAASDPALKETNAALDENNGQNAEVITTLNAQTGLLKQIVERLGAGGSSGVALNVARLALV